MQRFLVLTVLTTAVVISACDPLIEIDVENNTDALVCLNYSTQGRPVIHSCLDKVEPHETGVLQAICTSGMALTVVLTVEGQEIYANSSATCGAWGASGVGIVVERLEGEFRVTDSLGFAGEP